MSDVSEQIRRRKARKYNYDRRKTIRGHASTLLVTRCRRRVRLTIQHDDETFNYVDLDEDQIERLIRRLDAIRGGSLGFKRRNPKVKK